MAKFAETKFKERVLADLKQLKNIWFFKSNEVSLRGILDIIICVNGLFVAIELKKDKQSKPDALQAYTAQKIKSAGGISLLAYPENWHEILMQINLLAA